MSGPPPITFTWEGDAMRPLQRFARAADRQFVIGAQYTLAEVAERSSASHAHYFAVLHDAFMSVPETMADRWPTVEHLRKWALIKAGYRDEKSIVCASKAEAERVKAFIRPIDDYAVVIASEATVIVYTAKSQSAKAMGRETFQASKDAVFGVLEQLLGIETGELATQTQRAA